MPKTFNLKVPENLHGERLDKVLSRLLAGYSRGYLQELIETGAVDLDKKEVKPNTKVKSGEAVQVRVPEPKPLQLKPEKRDLQILYEDSHLLVLNKPAGLVVHPAPGHTEHTLVNALLTHCKDLSDINGVLRPGIVHRLDKETSGCLVVAKNNKAHQNLALQFEKRTIEKTYQAIVAGKWRLGEYRIEGAIGRHPVARKKMSVRTAGGKEAVTLVKPLELFGDFSFLELKLLTGRTHQIRVHLSHAGYPILGDTQYGRSKAGRALPVQVSRQMLHAAGLAFEHPFSGKKMRFTSSLPSDMVKILEFLRRK